MDSTDRKALIRAHFEAYRDLAWTANVLPRFEKYGVRGTRLDTYREAWHRCAEQRDWARWQEESEKYPNERLKDMLTDYIEKLDALGMPRWQIGQKRYGDILKKVASNDKEQQERSPTRDKGRERYSGQEAGYPKSIGSANAIGAGTLVSGCGDDVGKESAR